MDGSWTDIITEMHNFTVFFHLTTWVYYQNKLLQY